MRSAASRIEPVSPMRASRSTLPGPSAISSPQRTRIRGRNRGSRDDLAFMLRLDCIERQPLCQRICSVRSRASAGRRAVLALTKVK